MRFTAGVLLAVLALGAVGCSDDDSTNAGETFLPATTAGSTTSTSTSSTTSTTTSTSSTSTTTTSSPATTAPPTTAGEAITAEEAVERYEGLEYGSNEPPAGVTWLGGSLIGEVTPDPTFGVSFFDGPAGPMFWLEEFLSSNADGTPNWRVVAVLVEPRAVLPPEGTEPTDAWTYVANEPCTVDGEDAEGIIAVFASDVDADDLTDPVFAYQAVTDPPSFVPVDAEVVCPNPGAGV